MKNRFWNYCDAVMDVGRLTTREVINDIEAVAVCFDRNIPPLDCAQVLMDRNHCIPK